MLRKPSMRVTYAQAVYGSREIRAVHEVLKDPLRLGPGAHVKTFEGKVAKLFGKSAGIMVNSGSSANLLALDALGLPPGSEVITPVLTFSTTLSPIIQKGLQPVFIDVVPGTYVIDVSKIEKAITPRTRALMIPLLLGNIPDLARIKRIARKHGLIFIEDSCDTIGGRFLGKPTGSYSDISTTSFYASHIITAAGSGGMVCDNNPSLYKKMLLKNNWGRDSTLFGTYEKSEDIRKRFAGTIGGEAYDSKFIFSEVGYNFQSGELNAAFGIEQLRRLNNFKMLRKKNFDRLTAFFKKYEQFFILPEQDKRAATSWLAFPLTIRPGAPFSRMQITRHLETWGIQTRPVFTGNVLRQPGFAFLAKSSNPKNFPVADIIMRNGFMLGCHQGLTQKQLRYIESTVSAFLTQYVT